MSAPPPWHARSMLPSQSQPVTSHPDPSSRADPQSDASLLTERKEGDSICSKHRIHTHTSRGNPFPKLIAWTVRKYSCLTPLFSKLFLLDEGQTLDFTEVHADQVPSPSSQSLSKTSPLLRPELSSTCPPPALRCIRTESVIRSLITATVNCVFPGLYSPQGREPIAVSPSSASAQ